MAVESLKIADVKSRQDQMQSSSRPQHGSEHGPAPQLRPEKIKQNV